MTSPAVPSRPSFMRTSVPTALAVALLVASPIALAGDFRSDLGFNSNLSARNNSSGFDTPTDGLSTGGGRRDQRSEEVEYFLTLQPRLSLSYRSGRIDSALTANLPVDFNLSSGGNRLRQTIRSNATLDLWNGRFLLDLGADSRQDLINDQGRATLDPIADANQRETVNNFEFSPSFTTRLGGMAFIRMQYQERWSLNERAGDTINRLGNVTISPSGGGRIGWNIVYNHTALERDSDPTRQLLGGGQSELNSDSIRGSLNYRLTRKLSLVGSVGYESIRRSAGLFDTTEPTWNAGINYTPVQNFQLNLTYGQQFGRTSISGNLAMQLGRRWILTASVGDSLDTLERRFNPGLVAFDPDLGEFVDIVSGLPLDFTRDDFGIQAEISRTRRYSLALSSQYGRTSLRLSAGALERVFDFQGENLSVFSTMNLSRALPGRAQIGLDAQIRYNENENRAGVLFPSVIQRDRSYALRAGYSKTLSDNLTFTINLGYSDSDFDGNAPTSRRDDDPRTTFSGGLNFRL